MSVWDYFYPTQAAQTVLWTVFSDRWEIRFVINSTAQSVFGRWFTMGIIEIIHQDGNWQLGTRLALIRALLVSSRVPKDMHCKVKLKCEECRKWGSGLSRRVCGGETVPGEKVRSCREMLIVSGSSFRVPGEVLCLAVYANTAIWY